MADFRKWFLAFAVLALLSSFAVPASAQNIQALQCVANAGVPPTVRAEGLTELVGDLVLNCNGGIPTAVGQAVPQANVTVFLSTNITSRITASPFTEALLMVDEPHSANNPTVPLAPCDPGGVTLGICSIAGDGSGLNTYNGTAGRPNVFQGRLTGVNQVTFFGIPIDPPGTNNTRIIRITNVRGNANQLGVSSTLVPTQITMYVSITGSTSVPVNNPSQTVAFVQRGLTVSVRSGTLTAPNTFIQCVSANSDIAKDPTAALNSGGQNGLQFAIRFEEGFGSSWKPKNIQHYLSNTATGAAAYIYPPDSAQDIPGAIYNSETGFLVNGVADTPIPTGVPNLGATQTNAAFPTTRGLNNAGLANQGTRLMIQFNAVPNGTQLFVPTRVNSVNTLATSTVTGFGILTSTDANGGGAFGATAGNSAGYAPVSVFNGVGTAVYEIIYSDPYNLERFQVPVAVAFVSNSGNNLPAPGVQSTITGGFAPVSNIGTASDTAPIPRFAPSGAPLNSFNVVKCSCNILFPFVTNQQGYDTGVAIANTSVDPFGTTPQSGNVTLNYYSGGTPPPAQTTNAVVPGGQILTFTLSGGGNFGIAATPGFQGYIIAQAQFQYCHAFAYVSAQGALPTAAGASEGYLGIVLDVGGLNRTNQLGEVQAH